MILNNVNRILRHYGLSKNVLITGIEEDRVYGWDDNSGSFLYYVIKNNWNPDDRFSAVTNHRTQFSYREPGGVRPALQVSFHPMPTATSTPGYYRTGYYLEIDFDYASPAGGFTSFFTHAAEVISNFVTGRKTNQEKIAKLLDKRGIAK